VFDIILNPVYNQSIKSVIAKTVKLSFMPSVNEMIQSAVKNAIEPLVQKLNEQSNNIMKTKD